MLFSTQKDASPSVVKTTRRFPLLNWTDGDWLWFLIVAGLTVRICYPLFDNPFLHLVSDSFRHYEHATHELNYNLYSASDALGYQVWLSTAVHLFGKSRFAAAVYAGIMSATTAYVWYLWFKLCLPSKKLALLAYALIVWLPDWIKIYSYFMEETLLLPLVGLMLYFGWKAKQTLALKDSLLFAGAAGLSFITKATCAPILAITYIFLAGNLHAQLSRSELIRRLVQCISITLLICLLAPISFYSRTGAWSWFLPAQAGANKLYYESGKREIQIAARYWDRFDQQWKTEGYWFGCPSFYTKQLLPFSDWTSGRLGTCECTMDFGAPASSRFLPKIDLSWGKRIELTLENWIYLFVGFVWPTEFPDSKVNFERWLWPFFTLIIFAQALRKRRLNELSILCFGTILVLMFQQESIVEGRYRICWEGIVIPTLLLALSEMRKPEKEIGDG